MKACFMGLGYIGLPTAIIAAKHGVQIVGVDINPKVVEMTKSGVSAHYRTGNGTAFTGSISPWSTEGFDDP